jgi:hypothetical protein
MEAIVAMLTIVIITIVLLWQNAIMVFKTGYYEEMFSLHKNLFDEDTFRDIEGVMNKKHPF